MRFAGRVRSLVLSKYLQVIKKENHQLMILRQPYDQLLLEIIGQGKDDLEKAPGPRPKASSNPATKKFSGMNPQATFFLEGGSYMLG